MAIDDDPKGAVEKAWPAGRATLHRIGCTGWGYDDWRGGFYPAGCEPKEYLRRYARVFRFAEVDSSFYGVPRRENVERWVVDTPKDFVFALKVPRAVTHESALDNDAVLLDFLRAVQPLRAAGKLGPLVLQLPPSFRQEKHAARLDAFLASWPRDRRLAVELRHKSWWVEETYRALESVGAALVWSFNETGRGPARLTTDWAYARIVGDRALDEKGGRWTHIQRDMTRELEHWRDVAKERDHAVTDFSWAVNNHLMGFAPKTAEILSELLRLPKPDVGAAMRDPGQQRLGP